MDATWGLALQLSVLAVLWKDHLCSVLGSFFFLRGEKKKSSDASTILKSQGMTDAQLSTPSTGHFARPAPAEAPLLPSARWLA